MQKTLFFTALTLLLPRAASAGETPDAAGVEFFERKIRPVLVEQCYRCHSASKRIRGGLSLDSRQGMLKGGDTGESAIVPGKPEDSLLLKALRHGQLKMPPSKKLPDAVVADFETWIKMGAPDPRDGKAVEANVSPSEKIWSLQPITSPELPTIKQKTWPKSSADYFVLARLEAQGLTPSPDASRETLIRRLYFDLLGLPPDAAAVDAFVADSSPRAYEELVDSLLSSPRFGERWARHWLDVARYADTRGYLFQDERNFPNAYKYRDWVVQSFNQDLPFDQFVMQQLAADRMPEGQRSLEALGFLTLGRRFLNNTHDIIDDRIDVVTRGLLGLTVTCARCHNHKYDPISTKDYYALYGVFASSDEKQADSLPPHLVDSARPTNTRVFLRGNPANRGSVVERRFLTMLDESNKPFQQGSGRLELANAIVAPENPLTARVFVNRVWGHLFGAELVRTPSDFGTRSEPPSHPQLLDHLAGKFKAEKWSLKQLIRTIVLSRTYQQQSQYRPEAAEVDPENRLLWKMNRRRLDFETMRDSLLARARRLDPTIGGPAVDITKAPFPTRRTLYGFIDRQNLPGLYRTFDFASPDTHNPKRSETAVPQQGLFLMNDPFVMEQAIHVANLESVQSAKDPDERVKALFRAIYARSPNEQELGAAKAFLGSETSGKASSLVQRWHYGHGDFDVTKKQLNSFHALPHWTGSAWQGGPNLPDPKIGWVILNARGGHPGNDHQHVAVRRWIAPRDGTLTIRGKLKHPAKEGDGVACFVLANRSTVAGEWTAQNSETETKVDQLKVKAGDTIDFITDCRDHPSFDGFDWTVDLFLRPAAGDKSRWSSATAFSGDPVQGLDPWQRLAHVLLISNEIQFID